MARAMTGILIALDAPLGGIRRIDTFRTPAGSFLSSLQCLNLYSKMPIEPDDLRCRRANLQFFPRIRSDRHWQHAPRLNKEQ
ncbi:MAG: hypothetical protein CMJ62_11000 [Planctomycetaceae bacterium]|nr:hypothetical protein [Planctomycetaceae bacterium]